MTRYSVRYVHKISPRDSDCDNGCDIPDNAFSNRNTLAKALRERHLLCKGGRLREMRFEGDRVIAFPVASIWHSIILRPHRACPVIGCTLPDDADHMH